MSVDLSRVSSLKLQDDAENVSSAVSTTPPKETKKHGWLILFCSAGMLIFGTCNSCLIKYMNRQLVPPCDGCEPRFFSSPIFQAWFMFFGELEFFFIYYMTIWWICPSNSQEKRRAMNFPNELPKCPYYWWIVAASLDFFATVLNNMASVVAQASTVQMLRNFNVVITALLTVGYLRTSLRLYQLIGVVSVTTGLIITACYSILFPDKKTNPSAPGMGIVFAICGTSMSAFQFVFEWYWSLFTLHSHLTITESQEKLFRRYRASAVEGVGWIGLWGTIVGGLSLGLAHAFGIEDMTATFHQIGFGGSTSLVLIVVPIVYGYTIVGYTLSGMVVTKHASGLLRTVLQAGRTVCVWLAELVIGWSVFRRLQFTEDSWWGDKYLRISLCPGLMGPLGKTPLRLEKEKEKSTSRKLSDKKLDAE